MENLHVENHFPGTRACRILCRHEWLPQQRPVSAAGRGANPGSGNSNGARNSHSARDFHRPLSLFISRVFLRHVEPLDLALRQSNCQAVYRFKLRCNAVSVFSQNKMDALQFLKLFCGGAVTGNLGPFPGCLLEK